MVTILPFYRDVTKRWYFDFPDYESYGLTIDDLEMVEGADKLLDHIAGQFRDRVYLKVSDTQVLNNKLTFLGNSEMSGADYGIDTYKGTLVPENCRIIWLCDVTLVVWPQFPKLIFFEETYNI
jgi:hypothetical protein